MKGSGADAASFGTSSPAGAGAGRTDGASARTYPKRRSGLRVRAIDGEMVILDRQRQLVHQVNQTARFIWDRCDGQHALLHIAGDLAQVFDVDELTAQNDVAAVVRRLELVGLVDSVTGDGSSGERARRSGGGMNDV